VPVDLVTTSGSGLDPDISPEARCSRCRASPRRATCRKIASASWSPSTPRAAWLGLLGEPRVNVLALNLALEALEVDGS
jgi:K+-transporting ATPase ATPase C chain